MSNILIDGNRYDFLDYESEDEFTVCTAHKAGSYDQESLLESSGLLIAP